MLAIDAGVRYIKAQVDRFTPTAADELEAFKFAAAAYNKGPGDSKNSNGVAGLIRRQFAELDVKTFGAGNRYWNELIGGAQNPITGKIAAPVVTLDDPSTKEVFGYVDNIFYSDNRAVNGGRYHYYQQFYKSSN